MGANDHERSLYAQYWLHRAVGARAIGDIFSDERAKATMLRIADAYERMAQTATQIEAGLALLGKLSGL